MAYLKIKKRKKKKNANLLSTYIYIHKHTHTCMDIFIYAKIYVRKVPKTFLNVCPIIITSLWEFPSMRNGHGHLINCLL